MALTKIKADGLTADLIDETKLADNSIDSEHYNDGSIDNAHLADDAVGVAELSATGTASSSTFLRGDNSWATPTDTNTQVGGATGVDFNDDVKIRSGTGNDLEIYHDGTDSTIKNSTNDLFIICTGDDINIKAADDIRLKPQGDEDGITVIGNGAVELYHNNVKVFDTDANGITVVGPEGGEGLIKLYADEGDDNADKWQLLSNTNGSWYLQDYSAGSWQTNIKSTGGGAVELYYNNVKKLYTYTDGAKIEGDFIFKQADGTTKGYWNGTNARLHLWDNTELALGDNEDLSIYHDGSNSYIKKSSTAGGDLIIMADGKKIKLTPKDGDEGVVVNDDGSVELYYDGTKRFETTSTGFRNVASTQVFATDGSTAGTHIGTDMIQCSENSTGFRYQIRFYNPNSLVGYIGTQDSGTVFSTSSDYRLKENEVAISDGITRLKTLKPYRFNFKANPSKTVDGFFAHEVTPAVPEAITGEKDGTEMQGIDQSKLVPLLTAALQEAITKIETLETKVAALEAA